MSDGRERAQPVAVGPPRRVRSRAERLRAERGRRRKRRIRGFVVGFLIAVVLAVVFVGSKIMHGLGSQNDYAGDGKKDLVVQVHSGDSTTAIAETLHKQDVIKTVNSVPRGRGRQSGNFGDPARLLPTAHRNPGGLGGERLTDPEEPSGQVGDSRGSAARRHHLRQDQRHHTGDLHHDLRGQLRRARRGPALRRGDRPAHGGRKGPGRQCCRCRPGPSRRSLGWATIITASKA